MSCMHRAGGRGQGACRPPPCCLLASPGCFPALNNSLSVPALAPRPRPAPRSVHCAQAKSVVLSGIDGLAAPGRWVDFGLRALALGLHIPEGEEGEGGADLEILEFPYGGRLHSRGCWLGSYRSPAAVQALCLGQNVPAPPAVS